jgi:hypothetical protein
MLSQPPAVFLKMTGLRLDECDQLGAAVEPQRVEAERRRLERPNRQRVIGGGRRSELDQRHQLLLTVIGRRQSPTHEGLGDGFGVHPPTGGGSIGRVLPRLEQAGRDRLRLPDPGRKRRRKLDALWADTPELALVMDRFEPRVQRPKDKTQRASSSSGKKKNPYAARPDRGG